MTMIAIRLRSLCRTLCARFTLRFDLEGIDLDEHELQEQLGFGRE